MTTIAFWKPFGVLSKFTDAEGRPTLADFIDLDGVWGAGRLDRDSEGLLLLSTDRAMRTRLTDPKHHVSRRYWVQVEGEPDPTSLEQLETGVMIKKQMTRPARARRVDPPDVGPRTPPIRVRQTVPDSWLELTLTEGRNRQVRRMTAAVGHPTLRLVRNAVGPITLEGLTPGMWRELNSAEVAALRSPAAKMEP